MNMVKRMSVSIHTIRKQITLDRFSMFAMLMVQRLLLDMMVSIVLPLDIPALLAHIMSKIQLLGHYIIILFVMGVAKVM